MDQYIRSVLFCSLIAGIMEMILPAERTKRHLKFLASCIMILIVINPMIRAFPSAESLESNINEFLDILNTAESDGAEMGKNLVLNYGKEAVSEFVRSKLQEKFSVSDEEIEIVFEENEDEMFMHVILRGRASWLDGMSVTAFLQEQVNCPVKVTRK